MNMKYYDDTLPLLIVFLTEIQKSNIILRFLSYISLYYTNSSRYFYESVLYPYCSPKDNF